MPELPERLRSFLRELKRRRVVQVATVYAGVAFVVLQAADIIFPMLLLPAWLSRAVLALVVLGFPIALVLAWAFEMTPEGLERVEEGEVDAEGVRGAGPAATDPAREGSWLSLPSALAVGALVLVGVGLGWFLGGAELPGGTGSGGTGLEARDGSGGMSGSSRASGVPLVHLSVTLPPGDTLWGAGSTVAISPDGSKLVYAASRNDTTRLYLRPLDRPEAEPIDGTEGAGAPFFSPDGEWVGFFANGAIMKIPVEGGTPVEIAEFGWVGGSWGPGDTIVVGDLRPGAGRGLWRVPATGRELQRLTRTNNFDLEHPEQAHLWPQVLPGGRAILYTSWNTPGDMRVAVADLETGEQRVLVEPGSAAHYVPTGHLVYAWDGNLLAAPFDLDELEVTGPSVPVARDVWTDRQGNARFDVSESGTLVRVPGDMLERQNTLVWVDFAGEVEELPLAPGAYGSVRIGPDGSRIVGTITEDRVRVWLFDPKRGTAQRLSEEKPTEYWPIWSPDGASVIHNSNRYGGPALNLYRRVLGGSRPPERLSAGDFHEQPQSWTPDGKTLIYTVANDLETGFDIWALDLDGEGESRPVVRTPEDEYHPSLSPDGRWLAYASDRSGRNEVYLQRYPGPGGTVQVSPAGGLEPLWAPDGSRLFYRHVSGDTVWSVDLLGDGEPELGNPEVVITGEFALCCKPGRSYDLGPRGERFLMIREGRASAAQSLERTRIDVTLNWFGELERLVEGRR